MEEIAPSLKAIERQVDSIMSSFSLFYLNSFANIYLFYRLDGIEQRLHDTEREFDSARREAKTAKDKFNSVKQKRFLLF